MELGFHIRKCHRDACGDDDTSEDCPFWCSLVSVLEGERQEFEAACGKYKQAKQALMEKVHAQRDLVRNVVELANLPSADSPAR